ncbi:DUF3048 domain-containing protein [Alkaliphilus peptidifermentans]|uniref:DUF3048 domain-containing protein n=1 Tax=Alkaliphilus peptidifermentans DSM 18978 TaxID=1120976 RepID=A0A1G5BUJ8_9FIRM|nr:DUF3048 domain-containing protein [Alkaliphilus peptidifermentans]SCX93756.1 Protein of unknown function [Alkaliphilus peptidifermentans DSM 18978]
MMTYFSKTTLFFIIILMVLNTFGCSKKPQEEEEMEPVIEIGSPEVQKEGSPSPLSGLYFPDEKVQRRPLAIVFDNHGQARPQAGLIDAEIAYEFLAEGDITRYLGIFLANEPETIGGIRSARSYLIERALEFDAMFVHVGGSPQAFKDLDTYKVNNINAMNRGSDVFWRKNHKVAPHNMYSSHDALRKAAENSKYRSEMEAEAWSFHEDIEEIEGEIASEIQIYYSRPYQPSFKFNEEEKIYYRYYNGQPHVDEITNEQLTATNIIIQTVNAKVVDKELRLQMDTIGEGKGLYITNGKVINITWKKESYKGQTKFFDMDGNELIMNPGKTWIQIIKNLDTVTIL